jgi:hypothetical protein
MKKKTRVIARILADEVVSQVVSGNTVVKTGGPPRPDITDTNNGDVPPAD